MDDFELVLDVSFFLVSRLVVYKVVVLRFLLLRTYFAPWRLLFEGYGVGDC